jgi:hypothetical protein
MGIKGLLAKAALRPRRGAGAVLGRKGDESATARRNPPRVPPLCAAQYTKRAGVGRAGLSNEARLRRWRHAGGGISIAGFHDFKGLRRLFRRAARADGAGARNFLTLVFPWFLLSSLFLIEPATCFSYNLFAFLLPNLDFSMGYRRNTQKALFALLVR